MVENRNKLLYLFFLCLAGASLFYLYDRMINHRYTFMEARYTDKPFIKLMEEMIHQGVFKLDQSKVLLDHQALEKTDLGERAKERVKKSLPFLQIKGDKISFDRQSVSIINPRGNIEDKVLRGKFLDRNGVILAQSIFNEKSWEQKREYQYGPEFYPVIGHWHQAFGQRGLERVLDSGLTGKDHEPVYKKTSEPFRKLKIGDDVKLTLDSRIQKAAYQQMAGMKGAVVVLNINTGEILAAASTPAFDPNTKDGNQWRKAQKDKGEKNWENRAFFTLYPPGSTFKTVVTSAWLEGNQREDRKVVDCTGKANRYDISDIHSHGRVDLEKAFRESCNLFFSEIGVRLGKDLFTQAKRFGFNQAFDLIPQIKKYHYPTEKSQAFSWYEYKKGQPLLKTYNAGDFTRNPKIVAQGAIGQNLVTATPLQMAMIAATIANNGILLNPYLIKEIKTGEGKQVLNTSGSVGLGKAIKEDTAQKLKRFMEEVMDQGTGKSVKKIYLKNGRYVTGPKNGSEQIVRVAGKTGTAEINPENPPHSWFIGLAPVDRPRVAIAVIAENQGLGAITAAPIAMEVLAEALNSMIGE